MATNNLKELINKISHGVPSTFLKDLDMTWNMPNLLVNSNNMLVVTLAKTTTLPIIQNTDDIYSSLNVSPITEMHNINDQLNLLHVLIQKYCVQQFTIGSLTHSLIDDIIDNFDEITDQRDIDALMNYVGNVMQKGGNITHKGGAVSLTVLINCIFIMILLLETSATGTNIETYDDLSLVTSSNIVNMGTLQLDNDAFKKAVVDRNFSRSKSVNIEMALSVYDKKVEQEKNTIIGKLKSLISTIPGASDKLNDYINNFNEKSRMFSSDCEKQCVDIMIKSYENKVFENLRQIDDIATTEEKIKDLNSIQQQITSNAPREIFDAAMAAASSSVASVLTQDYGTPAALWLNLPYTVYNKLSTVSSIEKEKKDTLESAKRLVLTAEEKMEYNDKLFGFSKFYCQNSFNLKLDMQDGNINVIGDKIDYIWIIKLIDTLNKNIALQDAEIEASTTIDPETKKASSQILQNISDRLGVLRTIVDAVSNMIVNYGVYSSLTKEVNPPTSRSLDNIKSYFDEQLSYLNTLLDKLYEKQCSMSGEDSDSRCLEIQERKLQEKRQLQEKKFYVQKIQNELASLEAFAENQQREFNANLTKTNLDALWIASRTQIQSYVDFGLNALIMGQTSVKRISREATKIVASPIAGILEGALGSILDVAGACVKMLLTTPGGLSLFAILILILGITGGGWLFITFKWLGRKIIAICVGPFVFLYEAIKTGSGYILRPVSTFVVANEERMTESALVPTNVPLDIDIDIDIDNYNRFLQQQEEGEEYNPAKTYGGKIKRKRRTKKNKNINKKTHKKKHLKKKKNTKRGNKEEAKQKVNQYVKLETRSKNKKTKKTKN